MRRTTAQNTQYAIVKLPTHLTALEGDKRRALPALGSAWRGGGGRPMLRELAVTLLPAIVFVTLMGLTWHVLPKPDLVVDTGGLSLASAVQS